MPRSWTSWLSRPLAGLVLTAACVAAPPAAAATAARVAAAGQAAPRQTTRVFAMQPKLDLAWMDSRQRYRDKLFALADAGLRGADKPLIQTGADDVASHLRADGRNLVVWPEDTGLWASFTGQRAAEARASGSLVGAIATLFAAYMPQMNYYGAIYPDVAARFPPVRLLGLALTDTFGRVALETFSEMAAKYHVYLAAGLVMPQSWHVVCTTDERPPQEPCDEQNPAKVQALGDPAELTRGYVYEATSPNVSNMALVFGPDGKLISKQVKTYLTPIEVGQAEGEVAALDLVPGTVTEGLSAVRTPLGTLGFVTSKDAWMPDVVDRLEEDGVDLLIQPEFFVGDLATDAPGMWAADTLKASGYNDVLRHPGFSAMALPSAVGNVFDFSADQQSQIAERPTRPGGGRWLIGQPPSPGLIGVTPWVVPDPQAASESIAARRKRLGQAGRKLAPGSGAACPDPAAPGPCENGHVETVLWKDVPVGFPAYKRNGARRKTRFGVARELGRRRVPERNASVSIAGRFAAVAYEDVPPNGAASRIRVAVSKDGGRHWGPAREPLPKAAGPQQWPSVVIDARGRVTLAWARQGRVYFARGSVGRGKVVGFRAEQPLDPEAPPGAQWKPALALGAKGVVHAAYVDATRSKSADAQLPQAGIYYTRIRGGAVDKPKRLDGGTPARLAVKLDNAWSPSIAARGARVLVSWIDFQNYDWDAMSRLSTDGGSSFATQVDSNLEKAEVESLSDSPRPVLTKKAEFVAWTDFHKRDAFDVAHPMYDTYLAPPGKPATQVDPYAAKQVSTFWPTTCAAGKDVIVAFQDSAAGVGTIKLTRVRGGARRGHAFQVSDNPASAYRPAMACSGNRFVAAWEDMRNGPPRIYAASGSLRRVR